MDILNPNFTPIINTSVEAVHTNISYVYAQNQAPWMISPEILILFIILGVVFLFVSGMLPLQVSSDLSAVIAHCFIFLAAGGAWAVDTVTAYGVTSYGQEWVLLENHTIYHYDLLGVVLALLWVISWLNLYRLWLDHKRITDQEQPKVEMASRENNVSQRQAKPQHDEDESTTRG